MRGGWSCCHSMLNKVTELSVSPCLMLKVSLSKSSSAFYATDAVEIKELVFAILHLGILNVLFFQRMFYLPSRKNIKLEIEAH